MSINSRNIILTILLLCFLYSKDFLWPIQAKKELTAVFAEERPGRYHTGIDIRTFGNIGYNLVSIEDGYISRIRTSSRGYGKTIYIKLNDGHTAVYAHLDRFTEDLDNLAHALQQKKGAYAIDHRFKENEYPVTKGDIIGYSGDTGGVSGPHLHFEIRNENGQPINPFHHSIEIVDDRYVDYRNLALPILVADDFFNAGCVLGNPVKD